MKVRIIAAVLAVFLLSGCVHMHTPSTVSANGWGTTFSDIGYVEAGPGLLRPALNALRGVGITVH